MKMVDIQDLTFKYTSSEDGLEKFAVNGVNLEVEKGEFLVVLGIMGLENQQ